MQCIRRRRKNRQEIYLERNKRTARVARFFILGMNGAAVKQRPQAEACATGQLDVDGAFKDADSGTADSRN
jgi:hypothetical protein